MPSKLVFVHTVPSLVELFTRLSHELLPAEVEIWHVADEILLKVVLAQGGLSPFIHRRVAQHARSAEEAGARVVQLTCSSISPCADTARSLVSIPVLKIDEPMVDHALALGSRIGVVATAVTTLRPTAELIESRAQRAGKTVRVEPRLAEGAYAALFGGDPATHDSIVQSTIEGLLPSSDVVLLAQASMARVVEALPEGMRRKPILSSPRMAIEHVARVLAETPA